jgi:hypothetical protein
MAAPFREREGLQMTRYLQSLRKLHVDQFSRKFFT